MNEFDPLTSGTGELNWVVVSIDGPTVEFAQISPADPGTLHYVKSVKAADFATATDCIRSYAATLPGGSLSGHRAAIAVSGAITGDSIRVSRGGWIISVSGLRHMFGEQPIVLNDSMALGWAGANVSGQTHRPVGVHSSTPDIGEGRIVVINWGLGLGGAAVHAMPDGTQIALPCEFGHSGFSPENERELALHRLIGKGRTTVSWEQVLCLAPADPIWREPTLALSSAEIDSMRAEMAGSFASDIALSFTAWKGMVLTGANSILLENAEAARLFNQRFESKTAYRLKMRTVPRWLYKEPSAILKGCARSLIQAAGQKNA